MTDQSPDQSESAPCLGQNDHPADDDGYPADGFTGVKSYVCRKAQTATGLFTKYGPNYHPASDGACHRLTPC